MPSPEGIVIKRTCIDPGVVMRIKAIGLIDCNRSDGLFDKMDQRRVTIHRRHAGNGFDPVAITNPRMAEDEHLIISGNTLRFIGDIIEQFSHRRLAADFALILQERRKRALFGLNRAFDLDWLRCVYLNPFRLACHHCPACQTWLIHSCPAEWAQFHHD